MEQLGAATKVTAKAFPSLVVPKPCEQGITSRDPRLGFLPERRNGTDHAEAQVPDVHERHGVRAGRAGAVSEAPARRRRRQVHVHGRPLLEQGQDRVRR